MKTTHTACPLDCPDTCGVTVEADAGGRLVSLKGNPAHGYSAGTLCGKTALFGDVVRSEDRLRVPLLRGASGELEEVGWERAIEEIARRVQPLAMGEVLCLSYAGCMGLVNRRFPMRLMNALGAVETDGALCDETATSGYETVMGRVVGPDIESLESADLLALWGCDARRTLQHSMPRVKRLCARGAPVHVIDVYRTDTVRTVEGWGGRALIVKPGSDAALALCLARLAFERGWADEAYLARECSGVEEFRAGLASAPTLAECSAITGLEAREIEEFGAALARAGQPFLKVGVGWTRRRNGGMSMRAVCSLAAVLGEADRLFYESFDHFGLAESVIRRDDLRPAGAPTEKIRHVELGRELCSGRFGAAFVWGHNPAVTVPDEGRVRAGLAREDLFLVVHDLFLTETAKFADVVLPATAFVEQSDVYRSYGHRWLQYGRKACEPPAAQRSNVATFAAIGRGLGMPPEVCEDDEEQLCRTLLEASRARFSAAEYTRILAGDAVKLAPEKFGDRGTPSGKIELASDAAQAHGEPRVATWVPDDGAGGAGEWQLLSAPSIATHNSTFTHSRRHAQRAGAPTCHVHPDELARLGVEPGARLVLCNEQGRITLPVQGSADLPPRTLRVDGVPRAPEVEEGVGINVLVPPAVSDLGDGNVLYSTRVDVAVAD